MEQHILCCIQKHIPFFIAHDIVVIKSLIMQYVHHTLTCTTTAQETFSRNSLTYALKSQRNLQNISSVLHALTSDHLVAYLI